MGQLRLSSTRQPDLLSPLTIHVVNRVLDATGIGLNGAAIPDAQLDPPRQQLVLGGMSVQKLDMTVAGGEVYEMITGPRHMRLVIGLNGMRVYFADGQGVLQEYTNIVLGEPSASLFVPEPGAAVLKKWD